MLEKANEYIRQNYIDEKETTISDIDSLRDEYISEDRR